MLLKQKRKKIFSGSLDHLPLSNICDVIAYSKQKFVGNAETFLHELKLKYTYAVICSLPKVYKLLNLCHIALSRLRKAYLCICRLLFSQKSTVYHSCFSTV